jgi:hypothetical protein
MAAENEKLRNEVYQQMKKQPGAAAASSHEVSELLFLDQGLRCILIFIVPTTLVSPTNFCIVCN